MRLGDLLISAGLISRDDLVEAMARKQQTGGRLGDQLISMGLISRDALARFMNHIPMEPETLAATGINSTELMNLMIKLIHMARLETIPEIYRRDQIAAAAGGRAGAFRDRAQPAGGAWPDGHHDALRVERTGPQMGAGCVENLALCRSGAGAAG